MKVVLDTNVLLVCISDRSKLHWIFKAFLNKRFSLCVTTEILNEYAEIIERHMGPEVSKSILALFENSNNVEFIKHYFRFQLLKDADDNKFVDCAIASNANFIVSHDKDFDILKSIPFPKVDVINTTVFHTKLFH
jgi:putative PIN family toxin of toxin-antitoxin system